MIIRAIGVALLLLVIVLIARGNDPLSWDMPSWNPTPAPASSPLIPVEVA